MIFGNFDASIATLTFHSKHIVELNMGIAYFTPMSIKKFVPPLGIACPTSKSQYKVFEPPLGIAMDITLHMKFMIPMQVLHQNLVFLKFLYVHCFKSCNMPQKNTINIKKEKI
jgi:hypothetical protein